MVNQSVTPPETPPATRRRPASWRLWALVLGVGLLAAACTGSDGETSSSSPDSAIESDGERGGDAFSEGETTTEGTAAGADQTDSDGASSADPDETSGEADGAPTSQPAETGETAATDADDDAESEPGVSDGSDVVAPEPDEFDQLDDLITVDEVDDVPFCQSYARVFEAFLGVTFAGVFGGLGSADPEAQVALAETYEMIVYPGLTNDVETIRDEGIDELDQIFGPLFERIDAAPELLRRAGLSDDEIAELTTGVRPADLETVDLDGLDPRVTDAAVAMRSEFGSFMDASDALATPPTDEAAFEDRLDDLCPLLAESFSQS
jgi:hypothetical protein